MRDIDVCEIKRIAVLRIYTDGSCLNNKGSDVGGWAVAMALDDDIKTLSGFSLKTTNNQMELVAVARAINSVVRMLKKGVSINECLIHSDSAYVVNGVESGWIENWKNNGWKNAKGYPVKNKELWVRIDNGIKIAKELGTNITMIKVKGHAGVPMNELVDELAQKESQKALEELDILKAAGGSI